MGEQGLNPFKESTKMKIRNTNPIMAKLFPNKNMEGIPPMTTLSNRKFPWTWNAHEHTKDKP